MDKEKIIDIVKNVEDKSNKDLFLVVNELYTEHEKTKQLIIDLTRHLEIVEGLYNDVNNEIGKRTKK
jgi:hypothetical protein